jgi:DNA invertase Pin-like site-specific DNA recombinase
LKAGVYLRVSTDRQDEANQEPSCLKVCEARGWTPIIYREVESAVKERPRWAQLMDDVRRGEIRAVVFYSISRIGRRRTKIAADLAALTRWGASLESVTERFVNTDGSPEMAGVRDLLIQWWGWFAEAEREQLIERTTLGLDKIKRNLSTHGSHVARKSGRVITSLGRPTWPPQWKARALALSAAGHQTAEIARLIENEDGPALGHSTIRTWVRAARGAAAAPAVP